MIAIIDYGMGNIKSLLNAVEYLGFEGILTDKEEIINSASHIILPGVGAFGDAISKLTQKHLNEILGREVLEKGKPFLGICLGMQLMGSRGFEDGDTLGLGLIPNPVDMFTAEEIGANKIPHIGFNLVHSKLDARLFHGLPEAADFYFVHSYRMLPEGLNGKTATCMYGTEFLAAYEQDNIYATQFHPEKSQTNGLLLLKNFLAQ